MNSNLRRWFEANLEKAWAVADDLWAHPELDLATYYAADVVADFMESEGFSVQRIRVGDCSKPNGVVARWGEGRPAVGFVGDMDAYPNTGNRNVPYEDRVIGPGQGWGTV